MEAVFDTALATNEPITGMVPLVCPVISFPIVSFNCFSSGFVRYANVPAAPTVTSPTNATDVVQS